MSSHTDSASTAAPSSPPTSSTAAAPTTTTPSSSASTNAATSSSPSSSQATSGTSTSASSATTTSGQSSSSTTAALVTSQTVFSSGGTVETITQVVPSTPTTSSSSQNSSSSNSFFNNTGAVAGVFAVVGLVVIGLAIALIINCVRRRRAQKFDRDVAQAAAEAAASSRSPFEDYSYNNTATGGGGGGGGYGYSGDSHGTYQLPPMQPNDTYGMTEMAQYDPYAAGAASIAAAAVVDRSRTRKESETGAPGIAGVGARGLAREPSSRAPYHAFAGPSPPPHELQPGGTLRSPRGVNQDVLEAVGLAGPNTGPYPSLTPSNTSAGAYMARKPSDTTQHTHASARSQFGSVSSHPPKLQPGYPIVESYYPQRQDSHSPDPFAGYPPRVMPPSTTTLPNPHDANPQDATVPSPSLPGHQSDHNEDVGDLGSATGLQSEEQRMSYQDDADYSQGNRVLRVANE